jgi:4-amino-4-deoxy-L-arabinose transferase-like glycosyltransferase
MNWEFPGDVRIRWAVVGAVAVYLALAVATLRTARPWCDEAWFANPAFSLLHNGNMGTTVLEPTAHYRHPLGIQQYTYWIMPLHILVQVPWYAVFGFGLLSLRWLSLCWGLLGLAAVFEFVRLVSGKPALAAVTLVLLAVDFVYVTTASTGRMDMMSAALGLAALAVYVRLREHSPRRALLAAHSLVAAAAFTHPVGGMVALCALLVTSLSDRVQRKWSYPLVAFPPYLAGALAWGLYISRRPDYFVAQFFSNAEGRFSDMASPIRMLKREVVERYLLNYGLASYSSPAGLLKLAIIAFYVSSVLLLMCSVRLRRRVGSPLLILVPLTSLLALMILDSTRQAYYLVYAVVSLAMMAGAFLYSAWLEYPRTRPVLVAAVVVLVGVQFAVMASRIRSNPMGRAFLPAVTFLARNYAHQRICGSAEIGMALGFPSNFTDDPSLGFYSHVEPDAFVVEEVGYQQSFIGFQRKLPEVYRYINRLRSDYVQVYDWAGYQVYARHAAGAP